MLFLTLISAVLLFDHLQVSWHIRICCGP